jgi:hypothetical protein
VIKKINWWSLFILPIAIGGVLFLSPATGGQESQRGECEQACNETFKTCNATTNADRAACSAAYKECRDKCKTVDPQPSPTPDVSPTPTPSPTATPSPTPTPSPVPSPDGPESARGQCEQDCNAAFKACNIAPDANRAACSTAYKECRDKCKEIEPHPSPTATPTPTPRD